MDSQVAVELKLISEHMHVFRRCEEAETAHGANMKRTHRNLADIFGVWPKFEPKAEQHS